MKQRLFTKLVTLMLVCFMLFTLIGCVQQSKKVDTDDSAATGRTDNAAATTSQPAEKITVKVLSWWDATKSTALQNLKAKFEELNPNMKIEFTQIGSGYADKVITLIAGGGDMPDVMMLAMDQVPRYANAGAIQDLTPYVSDEYKASLYPLVLNALTIEGKLYAVARDVTTMVMFCNKKMFDDAGIPLPQPGWTVNDFLDICKKMTKVENGKPVQWGYYNKLYPDPFYDWFLLFGGDYVSADGKKVMMNTPESKAAMQFLHDLIFKYKVMPTAAEAEQFGTSGTAPVVAGKVAMTIGGLSASFDFDTATPPVEYAIVPLPVSNDGKKVSHAFVNTWCMPKGVKDPKTSWKLLEFLSGKEGQQIVLNEKMGLPASKQVDTSGFLAARPDNKHLIDSLEYAVPFRTLLYGSAFYKMWREEMEFLFAGQKSVDEVAAAIETQGNKILAGE
ncbi:MAG: sugar ABC transporter substrate-binding protein [Firmicutes bacterium]|nr:sugar ABC transporter substrate-binding protein [Bacillota bacterium]